MGSKERSYEARKQRGSRSPSGPMLVNWTFMDLILSSARITFSAFWTRMTGSRLYRPRLSPVSASCACKRPRPLSAPASFRAKGSSEGPVGTLQRTTTWIKRVPSAKSVPKSVKGSQPRGSMRVFSLGEAFRRR